MRTTEPVAAVGPRTLTRVVEDALAMLIQDSSEYAFIGFLGAGAALFAGVVLRLVHNVVADAMIVPAVFAIALLTMSSATVAFAQAAENLHPEAGASMSLVVTRAGAFVRPWLLLFAMLFAAAIAIALLAHYAGSWVGMGLGLVLIIWPALYSLPRSYYSIVLLTQRMSEREAEAVSSALFRRSPAAVVTAWGIVLTPAIAVGLIGAAAGFGAVSTGVAAFVFVASMPVAAAVMGLLFFDAAAAAKTASGVRQPARPPRSDAARQAADRIRVARRSR